MDVKTVSVGNINLEEKSKCMPFSLDTLYVWYAQTRLIIDFQTSNTLNLRGENKMSEWPKYLIFKAYKNPFQERLAV